MSAGESDNESTQQAVYRAVRMAEVEAAAEYLLEIVRAIPFTARTDPGQAVELVRTAGADLVTLAAALGALCETC